MSNNSTLTGLNDPMELIKRITGAVSSMRLVLRSQREMLAQRNLTLSSEPLDSLVRFGQQVELLTDRLSGYQVEIQQLRELARNAQVVNSSLDLNQVLSEVIDTVIALTGAERGYIVLKNPETGALEFRIARKIQQQELGGNEFIVSRTIVERVAQQGEPVVTLNAQEDTRFSGSESVADYQLRSILCVPLKRLGETKGVVYVDNRFHVNLFSEREQRLVNAFANQAAIAIENARLFEEVRRSLAEISEIKEFMDNIFASIGSGVVTADRNDLVTAINDAALRILNIRIEVLGQSLWNVLPRLYDGFQELVASVRMQKVDELVEVEPVIDERGQVNLNLKLSPLRDSGELTQGIAIVLDDLTELKQRQAQLSVVRRYLTPAMVDNIKQIDELQLGGEEREISVVFCDVRNFTTFSEKLPPEELMRVINKYMSVSTECIYAQDGIIDKYMGDAVVGLYNTQLNRMVDHSLQAVLTALRMVKGVQELHKQLPTEQRLFYGIGIHTGTAILGNVGSPSRKEFTAIGDTIQFAKLLQENALEGEIILSKATYELVNTKIVAEPLKPRKLKDHHDFTVMYRVMAVR